MKKILLALIILSSFTHACYGLRAPILLKDKESEISQEGFEEKLKIFIKQTEDFVKRMDKYERTQIGSVERIAISPRLIARILMRHAVLTYITYLRDDVSSLDKHIDEENIEKIHESLLSIQRVLEFMQKEIEANLEILDTSEAQSHIARALVYHVDKGGHKDIFDTISDIDNSDDFFKAVKQRFIYQQSKFNSLVSLLVVSLETGTKLRAKKKIKENI